MANELTFTVSAHPYVGRDDRRIARCAADQVAVPILERYLLDNVVLSRPHTETYVEIAGRTGLDAATVKSVLSRDRGGADRIMW